MAERMYLNVPLEKLQVDLEGRLKRDGNVVSAVPISTPTLIPHFKYADGRSEVFLDSECVEIPEGANAFVLGAKEVYGHHSPVRKGVEVYYGSIQFYRMMNGPPLYRTKRIPEFIDGVSASDT